MNPTRSLPKIALGQLPPPSANDDNSEAFVVPTQDNSNSPLTRPSPVKLNNYGLEDSDNESGGSDEESVKSQEPKSSTAQNSSPSKNMPSNNGAMKTTNFQQGQKRKSDDKSEGKDPFNFNESSSADSPNSKRLKSEFSFLRHKDNRGSFFSGRKSGSYRPTWNDSSEKEELGDPELSKKKAIVPLPSPTFPSRSQPSFSRPTSFSNKLKSAQACLERGEEEDFMTEFDYFITAMTKENATENAIYLSLQSLTKNAIKIEFRSFLRKKNRISRIFDAIESHIDSPRICSATSVLIYFMARDRQCFEPHDNYVSLIMPLLKTNFAPDDPTFDEVVKAFWPLLEEWAKVTAEIIGKPVKLGIKPATFSVPYLTIEALAFVCMHKNEKKLQDDLKNIGCLHWIINKVEKLTKKVSSGGDTGEGSVKYVRELNRCLRILETTCVKNKDNQVYMMTGGNFSLLNSTTSLMEKYVKIVTHGNNDMRIVIFDSMVTVARVLANITYENELCCTKLGEMNNFLELCMNSITEICPKFAHVTKDKGFDFILMTCALLVNLAEKSALIRSRLVEMTLRIYNSETKITKEEKTLNALTHLFIHHEAAARSIDEELDKELELDDIPEEDEDTNGVNEDGRLQRGEIMSEADAVQAIHAAMGKADTQMEDSVMASYFGLLLGCLIHRDSHTALFVKDLMPTKNFIPLVEQLNRFKEFMEMTHKNTANFRSLERILGALQGYSAL